MIGASLFGTEEGNIETSPDRISLFTVPLRCPAAPQIGCGSQSKPILLELQRQPTIAEAWLNGTGTLLVVVWGNNSNPESRTKVVQAILEKNGMTAAELNGKAREAELKSFMSGGGWYRGTDVDNLSNQEARIIAARLVHRVQAKVALSEEKAKALEGGWAETIARCFIGPESKTETAARKQELTERLWKVARENLDQGQISAFREAIAKGLLPAADDVEETKDKDPDCCALKPGIKS